MVADDLDYKRFFRGLIKYDEQIFLSIIFLLASGMVVRTAFPELLGLEPYGERIRTFPLFVATPAMILSFLFLIRSYLPPKIRVIFEEKEDAGLQELAKDEDVMESVKDVEDSDEPEPDPDDPVMTGFGTKKSYDSRLATLRALLPPKIATSLMAVLFLTLALLVGIFWAAPVLVVTYYLWFKKPLSYAIIVSIVLVVVIYLIGDFLNLTHVIMESPLPQF